MARKFFNQKIKKHHSTSTIVIGSIVGLLLVISIGVIISVSGGGHKDAVIKIRDSVAVEVNSKLPDKTLFFAELENVLEKDIKVSFDNVDLKKIGKYDIDLKVYKKKYQTVLEVVDTESPDFVVKDYSIPVGGTYKASDFVEYCEDNSGEECQIEFYDLGLSQEGEKVDYSNYTKEGSYKLQIVAKDSSGNSTSPTAVNLIIGSASSNPTSCNYGNSEYDSNQYNLAVNVSEDGCALDLNLYQNENIVAPVKALIDSETKKLEKEFSKLNLNTKDIYLNSNIGPVLNNTGTGIVGYTLRMEVSIINSKGEKEVIEDYYVNINGGRDYIVNKYL